MSQRILITGGAGFLGSHLCDRMIDAGNEVICLDNYFTGCRKNITHLLDHPKFELLRHDIIDPINTHSGIPSIQAGSGIAAEAV